jgi:ACS family glucarate transporter-like MFS transporter
MNYVFYIFSNWLLTYLVQARGFSLPESGWLYSLPFATGAALAAVGGVVCDALCVRVGPTWGCRLPAISGMLLVAVFLIAGVYASNPYVAIGLLSLCFGFTQFTEGAFWSASTYIAGPNTTAATGVLNTGGNAAGFFAWAVGWMSVHLGWIPTLSTGSIFALVSAGLWLMVRIEHRPSTGGTSHVH